MSRPAYILTPSARLETNIRVSIILSDGRYRSFRLSQIPNGVCEGLEDRPGFTLNATRLGAQNSSSQHRPIVGKPVYGSASNGA